MFFIGYIFSPLQHFLPEDFQRSGCFYVMLEIHKAEGWQVKSNKRITNTWDTYIEVVILISNLAKTSLGEFMVVLMTENASFLLDTIAKVLVITPDKLYIWHVEDMYIILKSNTLKFTLSSNETAVLIKSNRSLNPFWETNSLDRWSHVLFDLLYHRYPWSKDGTKRGLKFYKDFKIFSSWSTRYCMSDLYSS